MIFEDFLWLNDIYDGKLLQEIQRERIIKDDDTIRNFKSLEQIRNEYDKRVIVHEFDSSGNFFFIEVSFRIIGKNPFFNFGDLQNRFKYVVYKDGDVLYKLNGFGTSEILLLDDVSNESLAINLMKVKGLRKWKFKSNLKKRDIDKISNYLTISVLKQIKNRGWRINTKPYVINLLL